MTEVVSEIVPGIDIRAASGPEDMDRIRELFREYQQWLGVDLCFQDFDDELAALPGFYAPPQGRLFLAFDSSDGALVGCVGLRPISAERSEMKRLYVRDAWRGKGLGRALAVFCVSEARVAGYKNMCLDTLGHLHAARALYFDMGFVEIEPYYENPLDGVCYMGIELG